MLKGRGGGFYLSVMSTQLLSMTALLLGEQRVLSLIILYLEFYVQKLVCRFFLFLLNKSSTTLKPDHNKKYLMSYRKHLRSHATPAEAYLWTFLKQAQFDGRKFRRQHSIGNYIVDFFCYEEMLVIELDGEIHNAKIEEDIERDQNLHNQGIRVIRFENRFVFEHLEQVLNEIKACFKY